MERYDVSKKPGNVEEYIIWATKELDVDLTKAERYYNTVAREMEEQLKGSEFWNLLTERIKISQEEYYKDTGYELIYGEFVPIIFKKEYSSFLDKCYRCNVVYNAEWPDEPDNEWVTHENGYYKMGDIVRTTFIVKYLDGINWIAKAIEETCQLCNYDSKCEYEASEEGYYAVHYDIKCLFEVPDLNFGTEKNIGSLEIQISTQLKDVIKRLIHKYYVEKRSLISTDNQNIKWQWDYKKDEFIVNYLGHIIHYLEGTILDIRNRRDL